MFWKGYIPDEKVHQIYTQKRLDLSDIYLIYTQKYISDENQLIENKLPDKKYHHS